MTHMIIDNLEAYVRAKITEHLQLLVAQKTHVGGDQEWDEYRDCQEESQLRRDGLLSIIRMAIVAAAKEQPHNPFSINGDVNQPSANEHGTFPPPPRKDT